MVWKEAVCSHGGKKYTDNKKKKIWSQNTTQKQTNNDNNKKHLQKSMIIYAMIDFVYQKKCQTTCWSSTQVATINAKNRDPSARPIKQERRLL